MPKQATQALHHERTPSKVPSPTSSHPCLSFLSPSARPSLSSHSTLSAIVSPSRTPHPDPKVSLYSATSLSYHCPHGKSSKSGRTNMACLPHTLTPRPFISTSYYRSPSIRHRRRTRHPHPQHPSSRQRSPRQTRTRLQRSSSLDQYVALHTRKVLSVNSTQWRAKFSLAGC